MTIGKRKRKVSTDIDKVELDVTESGSHIELYESILHIQCVASFYDMPSAYFTLSTLLHFRRKFDLQCFCTAVNFMRAQCLSLQFALVLFSNIRARSGCFFYLHSTNIFSWYVWMVFPTAFFLLFSNLFVQSNSNFSANSDIDEIESLNDNWTDQ